MDAETGISYYRHRCYHAKLGRFCSRDPLGYEDGVSFYRAYFALASVDPWGLREWVWPWDPRASWDPEDTFDLWFGGGGRIKPPILGGIPGVFPGIVRNPMDLLVFPLTTLCPCIQSNEVTCACCLVEVMDLFNGGVGLVLPREIPVWDEFFNVLDCLCDNQDALNSLCVVWNGTGTIPQALAIDLAAAASCTVNVLDSFEITGLFFDRIGFLVELGLAHAQARLTIATGCTPCADACKSLLQ